MAGSRNWRNDSRWQQLVAACRWWLVDKSTERCEYSQHLQPAKIDVAFSGITDDRMEKVSTYFCHVLLFVDLGGGQMDTNRWSSLSLRSIEISSRTTIPSLTFWLSRYSSIVIQPWSSSSISSQCGHRHFFSPVCSLFYRASAWLSNRSSPPYHLLDLALADSRSTDTTWL